MKLPKRLHQKRERKEKNKRKKEERKRERESTINKVHFHTGWPILGFKRITKCQYRYDIFAKLL